MRQHYSTYLVGADGLDGAVAALVHGEAAVDAAVALPPQAPDVVAAVLALRPLQFGDHLVASKNIRRCIR